MVHKAVAFFFFIVFADGIAQDSISYKKRMNWVKYGGLATYSVGMVGLNQLWYSQSPQTSFHLFNDGSEWRQVDKAGHFFSAFHLSSVSYQALKWAGSNDKKRAAISAIAGFALLSSIEIFDGFSTSYGASLPDLAANATGSLLYWGQMAGWKEIRIHPKFSFTRSPLASTRPDVLGSNLMEEILKDYNGQTYWLSVDMDKFVRFPKWLNFTAGYGASNMKYARDPENMAEGYIPKRQLYLSLDFDLTAIPVRSRFLKTVVFFANMIKLPAPSLEFSNRKTKAHLLYF